MRNRRVLVLGLLVAAAGLAVALTVIFGRDRGAQAQPAAGLQYAAKFVCGTISAGSPDALILAPGTYATAVNVHNIQATGVTVFKKAVRAPREPATAKTGPWRLHTIDPDGAFEIDCPDIFSLLGYTMPPVPAFVKGFVVIRSPMELSVWGVYTTTESLDAGTAGTGVSEDIEVVPSKAGTYCGTGPGDTDGDTLSDAAELAIGTDPCVVDTDDDGCSDGEEVGPNQLLGGQRDPLDPWDYYDVVPILKSIDLDDVFAVLGKFGAVVGDPVAAAPTYDAAYDRGSPPNPPSPNPWNTKPPDGTNQLDDVFDSINSFGHSCFMPP